MSDQDYVDDRDISDSAMLWRRLHPLWLVRNGAEIRISSAAFDDSKDGSPMSVLLAELVESGGRTAESILAGFSGYGLAGITAGEVRQCEQGVMRTPTPDEVAHASVLGPKSKGNKRAMAKAARLTIFPPDLRPG